MEFQPFPSPYPLKAKYVMHKPGGKKRKSDSSNQAPPRRGRRTPSHQKGMAFPGMRNSPTDKGKRR